MKWTFPLFLLLLITSAAIYPMWEASQSALYFGNLAQIMALLIAGYNLYLTTHTFGPADAPRKAWARIGVGIWIWFAGQCLESYCDLVLNQVSYGTIADSFWVIGYFPIISGIYLLFRNFKSTGLPVGSPRSYAALYGGLLVVYAAVFSLLIWAHVADPSRNLVIRFLDVYYPTFDFVVIAVCAALIRISWIMRGGSLARSWILLGLGFLLTAVADLLLAASQNIESAAYRYADIVYFSSYFFIALSAKNQMDAVRARH